MVWVLFFFTRVQVFSNLSGDFCDLSLKKKIECCEFLVFLVIGFYSISLWSVKMPCVTAICWHLTCGLMCGLSQKEPHLCLQGTWRWVGGALCPVWHPGLVWCPSPLILAHALSGCSIHYWVSGGAVSSCYCCPMLCSLQFCQRALQISGWLVEEHAYLLLLWLSAVLKLLLICNIFLCLIAIFKIQICFGLILVWPPLFTFDFIFMKYLFFILSLSTYLSFLTWSESLGDSILLGHAYYFFTK